MSSMSPTSGPAARSPTSTAWAKSALASMQPSKKWSGRDASSGHARPLRQHFLHDIPRHVRQAKIAALEAECQLEVIQAQEVQNRRVQVMHVDHVFHAVVADLVRLAQRQATLHAAASQPHRERLDVM